MRERLHRPLSQTAAEPGPQGIWARNPPVGTAGTGILVGDLRGRSAYAGLLPERLQSRDPKAFGSKTRQWGQLATLTLFVVIAFPRVAPILGSSLTHFSMTAKRRSCCSLTIPAHFLMTA